MAALRPVEEVELSVSSTMGDYNIVLAPKSPYVATNYWQEAEEGDGRQEDC